jgi:hypothetical protein
MSWLKARMNAEFDNDENKAKNNRFGSIRFPQGNSACYFLVVI